jgi:hypothetical protein
MIWEAIGYDASDKSFFVCGPPGFMGAMMDCLKGMGVSGDRIFTEKFSMVPSLEQSFRDKWFKYIFRGASAVFLAVLIMIFLNEREKIAIREELSQQKEAFLGETVNLLEQQPVMIQSQAPTEQPIQPVPQVQQPIEQQKPAPTKKIIIPRTTIS